ncbi:hypothetical protein ACX40Y_04565 [Sphingomonas sp. RS6]
MDLSFARQDRNVAVTAMPIGLAILLVGIASRQAASPTARAQTRLSMPATAASLLAPADGAFHRMAAAALSRWQPV